MLKTRILLIIAFLLVVGLLFKLPKAVVENDQELTQSADPSTMDNHQEVSASVQQSINQLRSGLVNKPLNRNSAIFADSLAGLYIAAGRFDSAGMYYEQSAPFFDTNIQLSKSADAYYKAFTFSMDAAKRTAFSEKARGLYENLLKSNPADSDLKVKLAMTYMGSAAPMQGIALLREVLADNPKHEQALFNMGMLSVQSGQFAKAFDWLTRLAEVNPNNIEGQILLGVALAGTGDKEKARAQYEHVKSLSNDPAVQQQLDQYIKDLK